MLLVLRPEHFYNLGYPLQNTLNRSQKEDTQQLSDNLTTSESCSHDMDRPWMKINDHLLPNVEFFHLSPTLPIDLG